MKKLLVAGLLALVVMIGGCGSSKTTTSAMSAGGNWRAEIQGGAGEAGAISFQTSFTVGSGGGTLSVTNITFFTTQACFVSGATASGTLTVTSGTATPVTGNLSFTVVSGTPSGNTLTLTGAENGSTITGTWTLAGGQGDPTCAGTGTFTMTQS